MVAKQDTEIKCAAWTPRPKPSKYDECPKCSDVVAASRRQRIETLDRWRSRATAVVVFLVAVILGQVGVWEKR